MPKCAPIYDVIGLYQPPQPQSSKRIMPTQDIYNKFIEVNFYLGCMVSQPNCLFQHLTTMSLIKKIIYFHRFRLCEFIFVWKNEWVFLCASLFDSLFKGFTTITSGYVFLLSSGLCRVMKTESCFVEVITHD